MNASPEKSFGEELFEIAQSYPAWLAKEKEKFALEMFHVLKGIVDNGNELKSVALEGGYKYVFRADFPKHLEHCKDDIYNQIENSYTNLVTMPENSPPRPFGVWSMKYCYKGVDAEFSRRETGIVLSWDGTYGALKKST
jgi:hypothetical protein